MVEFDEYPFELRRLTEDEGGGWLITFPDLPGCMSDGESVDEAIKNGRDAFNAWMEAHVADGRPVPKPGEVGASGKFVLRVPKSLHARLMVRAKQEGVSMNTLAITLLAGSLGGSQKAH